MNHLYGSSGNTSSLHNQNVCYIASNRHCDGQFSNYWTQPFAHEHLQWFQCGCHNYEGQNYIDASGVEYSTCPINRSTQSDIFVSFVWIHSDSRLDGGYSSEFKHNFIYILDCQGNVYKQFINIHPQRVEGTSQSRCKNRHILNNYLTDSDGEAIVDFVQDHEKLCSKDQQTD